MTNDEFETPADVLAAAEETVRECQTVARRLDDIGQWLLLNAATLEDERAVAAGYAGMPPFLPYMMRDILDMAAESHALADKLAKYTGTPAGEPGALGFKRLRHRTK